MLGDRPPPPPRPPPTRPDPWPAYHLASDVDLPCPVIWRSPPARHLSAHPPQEPSPGVPVSRKVLGSRPCSESPGSLTTSRRVNLRGGWVESGWERPPLTRFVFGRFVEFRPLERFSVTCPRSPVINRWKFHFHRLVSGRFGNFKLFGRSIPLGILILGRVGLNKATSDTADHSRIPDQSP